MQELNFVPLAQSLGWPQMWRVTSITDQTYKSNFIGYFFLWKMSFVKYNIAPASHPNLTNLNILPDLLQNFLNNEKTTETFTIFCVFLPVSCPFLLTPE